MEVLSDYRFEPPKAATSAMKSGAISGQGGAQPRQTRGGERSFSSSGRPRPFGEPPPPQASFSPQDVKDVDRLALAVVAIEDAARRFDDLPVAPSPQFAWLGTALGVFGELLHVPE